MSWHFLTSLEPCSDWNLAVLVPGLMPLIGQAWDKGNLKNSLTPMGLTLYRRPSLLVTLYETKKAAICVWRAAGFAGVSLALALWTPFGLAFRVGDLTPLESTMIRLTLAWMETRGVRLPLPTLVNWSPQSGFVNHPDLNGYPGVYLVLCPHLRKFYIGMSSLGVGNRVQEHFTYKSNSFRAYASRLHSGDLFWIAWKKPDSCYGSALAWAFWLEWHIGQMTLLPKPGPRPATLYQGPLAINLFAPAYPYDFVHWVACTVGSAVWDLDYVGNKLTIISTYPDPYTTLRLFEEVPRDVLYSSVFRARVPTGPRMKGVKTADAYFIAVRSWQRPVLPSEALLTRSVVKQMSYFHF